LAFERHLLHPLIASLGVRYLGGRSPQPVQSRHARAERVDRAGVPDHLVGVGVRVVVRGKGRVREYRSTLPPCSSEPSREQRSSTRPTSARDALASSIGATAASAGLLRPSAVGLGALVPADGLERSRWRLCWSWWPWMRSVARGVWVCARPLCREGVSALSATWAGGWRVRTGLGRYAACLPV